MGTLFSEIIIQCCSQVQLCMDFRYVGSFNLFAILFQNSSRAVKALFFAWLCQGQAEWQMFATEITPPEQSFSKEQRMPNFDGRMRREGSLLRGQKGG